MAFLRSTSPLDIEPNVAGDGVLLRAPQMADFAEWAELRTQSRKFLTRWEPVWPRDDLTRSAYRRRLRRYQREIRDDQAYPFLVFRAEDGCLVGGLTLSNLRRGVAQACTVGYWIGAPFARQGLMVAAVNAVVPFVFETLGLHRLEAACLPANVASIGLLQKCGFTEEGYARRYLQINGIWQDHILFALLADDITP